MSNEEINKTPKPGNAAQPLGQKKVFDVMRPGKSPASPTSRPVIVGHKPQVKDDQFVPSADSRYANENPLDDHILMEHSDQVDIDPSDQAAPTEQTAKPMPPAAEQESATPPPMPTAEEPEPAEDMPKPEVDKDTSNTEPPTSQPIPEEPVTSAENPQLVTSSKPEPPFPQESTKSEQYPNAENAAPEATAATLPAPENSATESPSESPAPFGAEPEQKVFGPDDIIGATGAPMIDHAFVSHHRTKTKWWEVLLIFLLIVVLAVVALNFLIDAEVIHVNFDVPHTNLIK